MISDNYDIILDNILKCGGIGSIIFAAMIFLISRTGIFEEVRNEEGHFRKNISMKGKLGFAGFFGIVLGLLFWSNWSLMQLLPHLGLAQFWINAFGTFFIVHLFDLIVLDWLIVVLWHPKFLKMPDTDYYTKYKPHWDGFLRGIPFGVLISLIVSIAFYIVKDSFF